MARIFGRHWLMAGVAREMRRVAILSPLYDGLPCLRNHLLMDACTASHALTGSVLIFTRDAGMHSGGWWKNPDYERCWHLSLSFRDPIAGETAPKDPKLTDEWLEAFYGEDRRFVWAEPPFSPEGQKRDAWHYRVFCNPAWQPILPRGEVYSREFTEKGWLSYSELNDAHARALAALEPMPGEQ